MEDFKTNNYWVFNKVSASQVESDFLELKFSQGRNFNGEINDQVLFLTKDENNNWSFSHKATISNLKVEGIDFNGIKKYNIFIEFIRIERLKKDNYLSNYVYSLPFIKNFKDPLSHFKLDYKRLEKFEFQSIILGEIFYSRTAFAKYVNELPYEHKIAFIEFFISVDSKLYFGKNKNYRKALQLLETYLINKIIEPSLYLKRAYDLMKDKVSSEELTETGFSNEQGHISNFKEQVDYINEFIDTNKFNEEGSFFNFNFDDLHFDFNKYFKKDSWPIILD